MQRACIGAVLAGRDIIGCAPTGSGKTAAFALPILKLLSDDPFGVYAVVLTPAREQAELQCGLDLLRVRSARSARRSPRVDTVWHWHS